MTAPAHDEVETHEDLLAWSRAYCKAVRRERFVDVRFDLVEWEVSTRAKRRAAAVKRPKIPEAAVGEPIDWERAEAAGGRVADGRPFPATLSLTWDAFAAFDRDEWESTLRHELIHLEQYQRCGTTGHGSAFRARADELDTERLGKAFVIYQGHHGDAGAHRADVILPGAAYTEKNGTYVNTEGRVQLGRLTAFAPGEAREDWTILRALSGYVGETLPYDTLGQVRQKLIESAGTFAAIDEVAPAAWGKFGKAGKLDGAAFASAVDNFYMTCPISRNSETMARCTEAFVLPKRQATGTEG